MESWAFEDVIDDDDKVLERFSVNPPNVYGFGHSYYEHVVECLSNSGNNLVDGLQGRKSVELISAIYESVETEKRFFFASNHKGVSLDRFSYGFLCCLANFVGPLLHEGI